MRFAVEAWVPEYGSALTADPEASAGPVDTEVEVPSGQWAPITPRVDPAPEVVFVDGVRRIDAWVWITGLDGEAARPGIAASYAAGRVRCDGAARIEAVEVRRALFSAAPSLEPVDCRYGRYQACATAGDSPEELSGGVQQQMSRLEGLVAGDAVGRDGLLVVDGPLSKLSSWGRAVGYIKTHHSRYLGADLEAVVARLAPGQRTPLFVAGAGWTRYSWYLRLPGPAGHAWAGVIRGEVAGEMAPREAARLADLASATLPAYASTPHKDPRAPQNLVPVGELERQLRHRLGDPALVLRGLRSASSNGVAARVG